MTEADLTGLDLRAVRKAFERAAGHYDHNAVLQREIADRLMSRLEVIRLAPEQVLDLGCGTGYLTRLLRRRFPRALLTGLDVAPAMTRLAQQSMPRLLPWNLGRWRSRDRFVTADAEQLPFADRRFDLVVSNLVLQWCRPERVFQECRRVLRPGGLLLFSSFGPDTLRELRAAWQAADRQPHVHDFVDMHDLGDALVHARFADPVMDAERLVLTYGTLQDLLRDLKGIGAHNAAVTRHAGLTGKERFARFRSAYEAFRQPDGRLPASYEVVYGHAWVPMQEKTPGMATVSLDALRAGRG